MIEGKLPQDRESPSLVGWKQLRKPPFILLVLWSVAFEVTVIAYLLSKTYPDWTLVYTLGLASTTALAGTDLALWVQAYYSRISQDRQYQLDFDVRWWEHIYAPLYEDTEQAIQAAEEWRSPWIGKWTELRTSRFRPVVEPQLSAQLDRAQREFESYNKLWNEAHEAADRVTRKVLVESKHFSVLTEGGHAQLAQTLSGDNRFYFDPGAEEPGTYAATQFRQSLSDLLRSIGGGQARIPSEPEIATILQSVKAALKVEPSVQRLVRERGPVLRKARAVHELVLRRMPIHRNGSDR